MITKKGFSKSETYSLPTTSAFSPKNSKVFSVRVTDIVLDETHPKFELYGGWSGIGTIEFEPVYTPNSSKNSNLSATPYNPNLKNYPLVNEIIVLLELGNQKIGENNFVVSYYYLNPLGIWNHPHHNAYPNPTLPLDGKDNKKTYQDVENGSPVKEKDKPVSINLNSTNGGTFKERNNIQSLFPFPGDIIHEGRFGTSIRLGSTSKNENLEFNNFWSENGEDGEPILLIRNSRSLTNKEGWKPTIENIDQDDALIVLSSTQKLPLSNLYENYSAFSEQPEAVREYVSPQVLLSSKRITINSSESDILLSSKNYISLSSKSTIGAYSDKEINLVSPKVRLGNVNADEQLILGNTFMGEFDRMLSSLINLVDSLKGIQDWPGGSPTPNPIIPLIAGNTSLILNKLQVLVKSEKSKLLSNISYTK